MLKSAINLLIALLLIPSLSHALTGKVVSIADGDTITILDSFKTQHKIRLYGIDTPEKGQAFGDAAKKYTSKLVAGKTVDVKAYDTDKYGRTVGVVVADGVNVNQSLLSAGLAWQYQKYCKASFCGDWLRLEKNANTSNIGLWADNDPVPPWDWRKGARNSSYSKNTSSTLSPGTGSYHGNLNSHVFHSSNCRNYNCKNCIKAFQAREEAIATGYRPCGQCKP
jgi:micrococcal nuclease